MQKWEYLIYWIDIGVSSPSTRPVERDAEIGKLNKLGNEGWELSGTVQDQIGRYAKFIFKRPKQEK